MRLKKISLEKFGLFKNFSCKFGDINLFFGNNESGKTTLIDAILWCLFGFRGPWKKEWKIRYGDEPEAELTLEIDGVEIFFPTAKSKNFSALSGLDPIYFSNVFCVRAGELLMQKMEKKSWREAIIGKILGIKGNIKDVLDDLREQSGKRLDGKNETRFKIWDGVVEKEKRVENLRNKKGEAEKLSEKDRERKRLEEELVRTREDEQKIKIELERLKSARDKKELEEIEDRTEKIKLKKEEIKPFEHLKEEDLRKWGELEEEKRSLDQEKRFKERQREEDLNREGILAEGLEGLSKEVEGWRNKASTVVSLRTDAETYISLKRPFVPVAVISGFIGLMLVFLVLLRLHWLLVLLVIPGVFCAWRKRALAERSERIKETLRYFGEEWEGTDIEKVKEKIENKESEIRRKEGEITGRKEQLGRIREKLKRLEEDLAQLESHKERTEKELEKLRKTTGLFSLERFGEEMGRKRRIEIELKGLLEDWNEQERKRQKKELYKRLVGEEVESKDWDGERYISLEKELRDIEGKESEKEGELRGIERETEYLRGMLGSKGEFDIILELDKEKESLEGLKLEMEAAWEAYLIMKEVEGEAIQKIKETIENNTSQLFSQFTGGRYEKILVKELDLSNITTQLNSGEEKPLEWPSSGTIDQLYLAIRLALAEKSLPSSQGFLLLDDPFLTCDEERINYLLDTFFSFADKGWQLVFFTVNRTLLELFEKRGIRAQQLG